MFAALSYTSQQYCSSYSVVGSRSGSRARTVNLSARLNIISPSISFVQIQGYLTSWTQPEEEHAKLEKINAELAAIQKELSTVSIMVWMMKAKFNCTVTYLTGVFA